VGNGSGKRVLVVGITREDRAETLRSLRRELLIAGPIALLLATLAGYALAGLSLRPVESMRRRAAAISAERPGERLPVPQTRDEVERLGETLNEMLARLEAALERERTFVADAGHELRTPLALLRTELELALRHGDSADELREALRRSSEEVDRLAQLAESLLLIARSDEGHLALQLEELDPAELLASIVTRFEWRATAAGRPVSASAAPGLRLRGDRIRLEQALGNLVENALRHGEGEVSLTAVAVAGTIQLHVRDEGCGFPPDFIAEAFTRFARPDQGRARGGSGLGLSIVRTIAEAHAGSADAQNLAGGGTDVWISLPRAGPPPRAAGPGSYT
jgi:signal transduction histidine kinase